MKLTLAEAAQKIRKSESTVRRLIREGKIEAERVGRSWIVTDLGDLKPAATDAAVEAIVEQLRSENAYLREENRELRGQLEQSRVRSDTIILNLTERRALLEDLRQPFWRRWRRKKTQGGKAPAEATSDSS